MSTERATHLLRDKFGLSWTKLDHFLRAIVSIIRLLSTTVDCRDSRSLTEVSHTDSQDMSGMAYLQRELDICN